MTNHFVIYNVQLVTPQGIVNNGAITIRNGRIEAIETVRGEDVSHAIDGKGHWLLPGFIDIHVHGGNGADFMDGTHQAIETIARFHFRHGTTSMLPTTVSATKEEIEKVLHAMLSFRPNSMSMSQIHGIHLEGPFISPKHPGAQNRSAIIKPKLDWIKDWISTFPNLIRMVTFAPELEGADELISILRQHGVVCAAGHTDCSFEQMQHAVSLGLSHSVHAFNAMRGFHHRHPGAAGAILLIDQLSTEIIADGHHLHPETIRLLHRLKGEQLVLITDAMAAAGLNDGIYQLGTLPVQVKNGVAKLHQSDTLAGSTQTMIDSFRYLVHTVGIPMEQASRLASYNPARVIGIDHITGSIEVGKQADLLLLADDLSIVNVWLKGNPLYPQKF